MQLVTWDKHADSCPSWRRPPIRDATLFVWVGFGLAVRIMTLIMGAILIVAFFTIRPPENINRPEGSLARLRGTKDP